MFWLAKQAETRPRAPARSTSGLFDVLAGNDGAQPDEKTTPA